MQLNQDTVSASLVIGLLKSARSQALNLAQIEERVGLAETALQDPVSRVPYETLIVLLDELFRLSGDSREIGLRLGSQLIPGSFSALGYAAASCETVGEAINVIPQYESVTLTPGKTSLEISEDWATLSWTTTREPYSNILEEVILSAWVTLARTLTSENSLNIKVALTGCAPENAGLYASLFGDQISFEQPIATVSFPVNLLSTPIIQSDPFINSLMKEQADRIQQSLTRLQRFSCTVAECINRSLAQGIIGQEAISQQLHIGVRTLRRRLKDEGTNFQSLLDSVRREGAQRYLATKYLSIFEIAMLLGYRDHSAFSAAFKRWFGVSPQAYRDSID
ncbi:AraC family transcriptional regulator [Alkalimarinus coralli]|uniref:AraC family transcriptional regulator n=1 Tax=Alkalimarinus coralli TaxID=2935863 RepID=UPI00202AF7DC|nr:AraC family transcriptional regulator [Alkalimarinus coralli]